MIRDRIDDLGGRRFILSVSCLYVCSALLMGGWISDTIYRDLILGTVAVYILGNGVQKYTEAKFNNESINERAQD